MLNVKGAKMVYVMSRSMANRILQRRETLGLSQAYLARHIGVTPGAVSQWENQTVKDIKLEHFFRLARLLHCRPYWLATGEGPIEPSTDNGYPMQSPLDPQLAEWVELGRNLTPEERQAAILLLKR